MSSSVITVSVCQTVGFGGSCIVDLKFVEFAHGTDSWYGVPSTALFPNSEESMRGRGDGKGPIVGCSGGVACW